MGKLKLTQNKGAVTEKGASGVELEDGFNNVNISPYKLNVKALTANYTISPGEAGVFTMSGSTGTARLTATLPSASLAAGCMMVFRVNSADQMVVTASQEANLAANITLPSGSTQGALGSTRRDGSKLILPNISGSSAILLCDGVSWNVIGGSGSLTFGTG